MIAFYKYAPFGLEQGGSHSNGGGSNNRYRYNGKELDEATGLYDYGARYYDPTIGRWGQVDPLTELFPRVTQYNYVGNDPISYLDPDGRYRSKRRAERQRRKAEERGYDVGGIYQSGDEWGFSLGNGSHAFKRSDWSSNSIKVDTESIGTGILLTNTAVGLASVYTAYKGEFHLANELWRYQPHGAQRFITPWSKTKSGQSYWNNHFAKQARNNQLNRVRGIRGVNGVLTKAGGVLIVADIAISGELKPSHVINATMLGLSTTGFGTLIAGGYFLGDIGVMGVNWILTGEAKGIGDMIDEKFGTYELYEGAY